MCQQQQWAINLIKISCMIETRSTLAKHQWELIKYLLRTKKITNLKVQNKIFQMIIMKNLIMDSKKRRNYWHITNFLRNDYLFIILRIICLNIDKITKFNQIWICVIIEKINLTTLFCIGRTMRVPNRWY